MWRPRRGGGAGLSRARAPSSLLNSLVHAGKHTPREQCVREGPRQWGEPRCAAGQCDGDPGWRHSDPSRSSPCPPPRHRDLWSSSVHTPLWGQSTSWGNIWVSQPPSRFILSCRPGRVSQPQPRPLPVHTLVPAPATAGTVPSPQDLVPPWGPSWYLRSILSPGRPWVTGLVDLSGQGLHRKPNPGDPQLEGKGGESDSRITFMQLPGVRQLGPFSIPD